VVNPKHDDCATGCDQQAVQIRAGDASRTDGAKQEAAYDGTDDAKHDIEEKTLTRAIDDLAGDEASNQSQDNPGTDIERPLLVEASAAISCSVGSCPLGVGLSKTFGSVRAKFAST